MSNTPLASRRTVLTAAAWTAPAIAATTAVPTYAASTTVPLLEGDLEITVTDPPFNWDTFEENYSVPVYAGGINGARRNNLTRVLTRASLPQSIIVTNVGSTPVTGATGQIATEMLDVGVDIAPVTGGTDKQIRITTDRSSGFEVTDTRKMNSQGAAVFEWFYSGTIQPGQSVEMPFKYYVHWPFTNVDFEVLVTATVGDAVADDNNDEDVKMGTVRGLLY